MTNRTVEIDKATLPELREFATNTLGISFPVSSTRASLLAKVRAAHVGNEITVSSDPAPAPAPRPAATVSKMPIRDATKGVKFDGYGAPIIDDENVIERTKVTVRINPTEEPGGEKPVELAVNGRFMLVERDKEQEIPYPYYVALRHAVSKRFETDERGLGIGRGRDVPLYTFQVLGHRLAA